MSHISTFTREYILKYRNIPEINLPNNIIDIFKKLDDDILILSKSFKNKKDNNYWRKKTTVIEYKDELDKKKKKINALFNKITDINKNVIIKELVSIIDNQDILIYTINILFNNVIEQYSFSDIYIYIYKEILKLNLNHNNIVYNTLLNTCLDKLNYTYSFQLISSDNNSYDDFCLNTKNKKIIIGTFKFIGELYNNDIFTDLNLFDNILNKLFSLLSSESNDIIEIYLNSLYEFIVTIWKKFNNQVDTKLIDNIRIYKNDKDKFNNKIRFKMMDLIEYIDKN